MNGQISSRIPCNDFTTPLHAGKQAEPLADPAALAKTSPEQPSGLHVMLANTRSATAGDQCPWTTGSRELFVITRYVSEGRWESRRPPSFLVLPSQAAPGILSPGVTHPAGSCSTSCSASSRIWIAI
jgi:hypothetical protein